MPDSKLRLTFGPFFDEIYIHVIGSLEVDLKKYILSAWFLFLPVMSVNVYAAAEFGGVGIDGTPLRGGEILVRQVVAGGPAFSAGIRMGDVITAIDGKQTKGSDFAEMVRKRLRGRAGTKVRLTIRKPGHSGLFQFTLVRRELILRSR
jgi:C-terminal processing protease CtpA/Prc